ncbi:hypothetical protein [Brucella rhizosphaerae]|uniref:Uncharacterized protein n=1 Tax=Brucella rhizosphaerae TaxID=571254 RepID=A0A256FL07_9HYPH|nr:hypothetical protein [Brucella rhizosphaerae]OYR15532.1 hypothetical protein CEV32_4808 [Brucella rhizosphaerae]
MQPKNYKTDGGDTLVVGGKLVIEDGATVEGLEGGGAGATAWADITGKPAVIAAGADQAAARTAIGAGTSSLAVATTAPAALAIAAAVGTGTTAARADHVHALPVATALQVVAGTGGLAAGNLQVTLQALATRIAALEAAAA